MTSWVFVAIAAYLLLAINGIVDKFLLTKTVRQPVAYAFYVGLSGAVVLLLLPFGVGMLSVDHLVIALAAGASFIIALFFFYTAIQQTSISRVLPLEGGLVPVFTLLLAYLIVGTRLTGTQLLAFALLVVGAVLVSIKKEQGKLQSRAFQSALLASIFFALSFVLTKYIYDVSGTSFITGLFWTRIGLLLAALCLLLKTSWRHAITRAPKQAEQSNIVLFYGAQLVGGAAAILQNYAIAIGNVVIVNALQGTQFAFTLIFTTFLSYYYPRIIREKITAGILAQKIIAILLISVGLWFLHA